MLIDRLLYQNLIPVRLSKNEDRLRSTPMEIDAMEEANSYLTGSIRTFVEAHFREEIYAEVVAERFGISRE